MTLHQHGFLMAAFLGGILLCDEASAGLNGDGNLDAVFANFSQTNRVCLGDGAGGFTCTDVSGDTRSSVAVGLTPLVAQIDIKPRSDPNSWPCKKVNNPFPVALLSDATFDATTVDADSVRFGKSGIAAAEAHTKNGKAKRHVEDVNKDGLPDMVFHFRFGDTGFSCADISLSEKSVTLPGTLTGNANGTAFRGQDSLRLVGK